MKKNKYKRFWRRNKKMIEISVVILIVLIAFLIELVIVKFPLTQEEKLDSVDNYCKTNCESACLSRGVELMSYTYDEFRCECSCTKNLHAMFGIDFLRN